MKSSVATLAATTTTEATSEFRAGVTAALRTWSALRTAVDGEWGGMDSKARAEDLRANIYDCFSSKKAKLTMEDFQDNLVMYMEDEFSVVLEDDSDWQLTDIIYRMYETCQRGDYSVARAVVADAEKISALYNQLPAAKKAFVVQTEDEMDDSDIDDHDDDVMEDDDDYAMDDDGILAVSGNNHATAMAAPSISRLASDTTAVSSTVVSTVSSPQEYTADFLFGVPSRHKVQQATTSCSLGEFVASKMPEIELDEDGFALVVKKRQGK